MRVSSASDLPCVWQLLGRLSGLHFIPLSGASGLSSQGLWIPSWFGSSLVEHTRIYVPTPYPALGDTSLPSYMHGWQLFLSHQAMVASLRLFV